MKEIPNNCLSKVNVVQSSDRFNSASDQFQLNENEQELGLFKHFNISEQIQERLKGIII